MSSLEDLDKKIFNITWERIEGAAADIASTVDKMENKPEIVICEPKDTVFASLVANYIELPLIIIHPDRRISTGVYIDNMPPKISGPIRSGEYYQPRPCLLYVASLIDKDTNISSIVSQYQRDGHDVLIMCAYSRANVDKPVDYHSGLFAHSVNVIFPWERK
jgi:hypothetical protein